ncbi:MAG: dethiobiotin synthase [Methylococcales bacterium]|jgi:dethiobiotin synthetase|nr:dethiobiotin synthase [Methylococcales bacterium]MBT7445349.1 dethiobiotin synthase [Methylococcales bacterium]
MNQAFFITGTDTDVGKTWVTLGLIQALKQQGHRTNGIKPVAAGCEHIAGEWVNADAVAIQQVSDGTMPYSQVNPIALQKAMAPHLAAEQENRTIDFDLIKQCCTAARAQTEYTIIEGAGGWRVPLGNGQDISDLAYALDVPVILVVGMRLGCLNHALLTYDAIKLKGLTVQGWIANQIDPQMHCLTDNIATLKSAFAAPCLGEIPYLKNGTPIKVSQYLSLSLPLSLET